MITHYPTNIEPVSSLEIEEQTFWLKLLDDMDRGEANYQRKIRYHQVSSLDFIVFTSLYSMMDVKRHFKNLFKVILVLVKTIPSWKLKNNFIVRH